MQVPSQHRCRKDETVFSVLIEPGQNDGHQVVFKHRADQAPGQAPGHVVFTLRQEPHKLLLRRGHDLLLDARLSLKESLAGFTDKTLLTEHIDGQPLLVSAAGRVTAHKSTTVVRSRGMPVLGSSRGARGDVHVRFSVAWPSSKDLDAHVRKFFEKYGEELHY